MTRFDLFLRRTLYLCAILALLSIPYAAFKLGKALDSVNAAAIEARKPVAHADDLIVKSTAAAEELRLAASRFNEPARVERFDDYLQKQAASALANTQNTRRIGANLNTAIKEDLRPFLQELRSIAADAHPRINAQLDSTKAATDKLTQVLEEGRALVADSREQVIDILKELNQTSHGLQVLVNDPELAKMIDNLNSTAEGAAATSKNIEVITTDLAGLSNKYLQPLYKPQKRSFFGKLGAATLTVFRYVTGASNVIYLIGRF